MICDITQDEYLTVNHLSNYIPYYIHKTSFRVRISFLQYYAANELSASFLVDTLSPPDRLSETGLQTLMCLRRLESLLKRSAPRLTSEFLPQ